MDLPKDPIILLSVVNTKLRDFYPTLEAFCREADVSEAELRETLAGIEYEYDPETNQFV